MRSRVGGAVGSWVCVGLKEGSLHTCPDKASWLMQGLQRERHAQTKTQTETKLELMFFEKPTHYFHARCDPRHLSDTTFTSLLDPADGQYVGLDTPEGRKEGMSL